MSSETRRGFFATIAAVSAALVGAAAAVPFLGALLSPIRRRMQDSPFIPVGKLDALPDGRATRAPIVAAVVDAWTRYPPQEVGAVWLLRKGGEVHALSTICPHLGCSVDATASGFACPCHDSAFDAGGGVKSGPSPRPLDPLECRVVGGEVQVQYARFVIGVKDRKKI